VTPVTLSHALGRQRCTCHEARRHSTWQTPQVIWPMWYHASDTASPGLDMNSGLIIDAVPADNGRLQWMRPTRRERACGKPWDDRGGESLV